MLWSIIQLRVGKTRAQQISRAVFLAIRIDIKPLLATRLTPDPLRTDDGSSFTHQRLLLRPHMSSLETFPLLLTSPKLLSPIVDFIEATRRFAPPSDLNPSPSEQLRLAQNMLRYFKLTESTTSEHVYRNTHSLQWKTPI